jgi:hypothetical protein
MAGLTENDVKSAQTKDKELFLWDGQLPGFGCRIKPPSRKNPEGVKTFFLQYRAGVRTRRVKIGRHPGCKVEVARKKAIKLLGEIGDGDDPSEEKRREREMAGDTVAAIAAQHIEEYAKPNPAKKRRGIRSWRERQRIFKVYVNPVLGPRPFREVKSRPC